MRIIGIKLKDGLPSVVKNLKPNTWYPFGNYNEPTEQNEWKWSNGDDDDFMSSVYKAATEEAFPTKLNISVSCIVGQNGSGKTTLLELMFRIINNFAYTILDKKRSNEENEVLAQTGRNICEAGGFAATLFFETDGNLGIIDYSYGNMNYSYVSKTEYSRIESERFKDATISSTLKKKLLAGFFYTICTNYSIHSFSEEDYNSNSILNPQGDNGVDGKWVKGLLHKNDGYLDPMVVVPYRDSWGNIDISNEKKLADQRLATLSILFWSQGKTFMEKYKPAYIEYRFDERSSEWFYNKYHSLFQNRMPLNLEECDERFSELRDYWLSVLRNDYTNIDSYPQEVLDAILIYLTYKTLKVCVNYPSFGVMLGLRKLTEDEIERVREQLRNIRQQRRLTDNDFQRMSMADFPNEWYKKVVDKILTLEEQTHITLKIRQVLEFIDRGYYHHEVESKNSEKYLTSAHKISVNKLIADNLGIENKRNPEKQKRRYNTYDEVFQILPPAFYEWRLYLLARSERIKGTIDGGILMNKMSSGEKQMLQSASYLLYHIKNIESVKEDTNRKAYHHIIIVLDEAELYYHPEMQRTMIANIIKMLSWCHINNTKIRSVHIMIVTHSPFVLSDVPKDRILYLKDGNVEKKQNQTFAANIHDLLYNQFFIENPIGEVAYSSVKKIVDMYNEEKKRSPKDKELFYENVGYYRRLVDYIGEKYLQNTLTDMLDTIMLRMRDKHEIESERDRLQKRLAQIENILAKN